MKFFFALLFAAGCATAQPVAQPVVTYPDSMPAPLGGTVDMVDWMTMNASLRGGHHMEPQTITSQAWDDKIVYTKFSLKGDNYDVWTFDTNWIYGLSTGTPTTFVKLGAGVVDGDTPTLSNRGQPILPRIAQMGFPGTRSVLALPGPRFQVVTDCIPVPVHVGATLINELWGPYAVTFAGNIGVRETIRMRAYWNCADDQPASCTELEVYEYTRPEGWVSWTWYRNPDRTGAFVQQQPSSVFDNLVEDLGAGFIDWCDAQSLLPAPTSPAHKPITKSWPTKPSRKEMP